MIEGEAPPGAEFVVDISCDNGAAATPSQLTFTDGGTQQVSVNSGDTTCMVTESETAGALEVRYCVRGQRRARARGPTCSADGTSVSSMGGGSITAFTITNDYVPEPPPPPPAPVPVVAEVTFTG